MTDRVINLLHFLSGRMLGARMAPCMNEDNHSRDHAGNSFLTALLQNRHHNTSPDATLVFTD